MEKVQSHRLEVHTRYFDLIEKKIKTFEGRVNKPKYQKIKSGDSIEFAPEESSSRLVIAKVLGIHKFKSFKEMIEQVGLFQCLPGVDSIEEGVNIYHSFPQYKEDAEKFGVVAFKIQVVSDV